jgi:hypothetical protein
MDTDIDIVMSDIYLDRRTASAGAALRQPDIWSPTRKNSA